MVLQTLAASASFTWAECMSSPECLLSVKMSSECLIFIRNVFFMFPDNISECSFYVNALRYKQIRLRSWKRPHSSSKMSKKAFPRPFFSSSQKWMKSFSNGKKVLLATKASCSTINQNHLLRTAILVLQYKNSVHEWVPLEKKKVYSLFRGFSLLLYA